MPWPSLRMADPVLKPQSRDVADLGQCRGEFRLGIVADPLLEGREDRFRGFVPPHADNERKSEFLRMGRVGALEPGEIGIAQPVETEPALFGLRFSCHRARTCNLPGKLGMPTQERKLLLARRIAYG